MPPKKQNQTQAAQAVATTEDGNIVLSDEQKEMALNLLFQDMDKAVENRCQAVMNAAEAAVKEIRTEMDIRLKRLDKKLKSMPLKDFHEQYGGNLSAVIADDISNRMQAQLNSGVMTPAVSGRTRGMSMSEGPAARTVLRTKGKRRGERSSILGPAATIDQPAGVALAFDKSPDRMQVDGAEDEDDEEEAGGAAAAAPPPTAGFVLRTGAGPKRSKRRMTAATAAAGGEIRLDFTLDGVAVQSEAEALPEDVRLAMEKVASYMLQKQQAGKGGR